MKKYFLGVFAIALAVGFSAFSSKPVAKDTFWFSYVGAQNQPARVLHTNYNSISSDPGSTTCPTGSNECAIAVSATVLDENQIVRPDFSAVSFDGNGIANGGLDLVQNRTKE